MNNRHQRCIVIWNDCYFGPFFSASAAFRFARRRQLDAGWRIVELYEPTLEK